MKSNGIFFNAVKQLETEELLEHLVSITYAYRVRKQSLNNLHEQILG